MRCRRSMTDYEWYKSKGICPMCRINDAFPGHVHCTECLEKITIANTRYDHKRGEYQISQNRARKIRYAERKQAGLCVTCGKSVAQHGTLCNRCYTKRMVRRKNSKEYLGRERAGEAFRRRMSAGLCMYCGMPQAEGSKLCNACLEKRRGAIKKAREKSIWKEEIHKEWEIAKLRNSHVT